MIRAGRRGGKTVGVATLAVDQFLKGRRVLYGAPTEDQVDRFWFEVNWALEAPLEAGRLYRNMTRHLIELPGTTQRIRAKTAFNADTLRGDFADLLILDEWQMMNEDAWELVGAPMLLDNNGDAVFIYTPPSVRTIANSRARDKMHAAKMYRRASADTTGRWAVFHFSSHMNPYISAEALAEITQDMSRLAYEQEIEAQDKDSVPGAMWTIEQIDRLRVTDRPQLVRIVVAVDPSASGSDTSDEAGIIAAGLGSDGHGYVLEDVSLRGTPDVWATAAVTLYNKWQAEALIAEVNQGGDMVALTISTIKNAPPVKKIHAKRGKVARAEPVKALYEPIDRYGNPLPGRVHHVGYFAQLESEMVSYLPGMASPNRLDALVYALTELMIGAVDLDSWADQYRALTDDFVPIASLPELPYNVQYQQRPLGNDPFKIGG